jgi:hypothetical protein
MKRHHGHMTQKMIGSQPPVSLRALVRGRGRGTKRRSRLSELEVYESWGFELERAAVFSDASSVGIDDHGIGLVLTGFQEDQE